MNRGGYHLSKAKWWPFIQTRGEDLLLDSRAMVRPNVKTSLSPIDRTARLLILAMVLMAADVFDWPSHEAQAQQVQQGSQLDLDYSLPTRRGPKLRHVRRPPTMPPTPKDFGPHFDFPAGGSENFNCGSGSGYYCGAPSEAPYPN